MGKYRFLITILSVLFISNTFSFSFKSFYSSIFTREKYDKVIQKEIPVPKQQKLILESKYGPITIQTWQQSKILLKAIKRTTQEEFLPNISIDIKSSNDRVAIKTIYKDETQNGSVEYQLLVPSTMNIALKTNTSQIKVEHITGSVSVHAENGDTNLHAIQGPIDVEIAQNGSIVIEQPGSSLKASTHYGTIDIHDAKKSIFASTDSGKIRASSKFVPSGSMIKLDATGPITLQLPTNVNSGIQAETEQGSIICDHYLTIKPFITQLNSKAWTQFKRNTNGIFGNGGAQISLHSVSGNIKITKTT